MKRTTYKTDRELRSKQPWFASRRSAPDWPDMRVVGLRVKRGTQGRDFTICLVRAADVTWLDDLPSKRRGSLGLFIPAGMTLWYLNQNEYAEFGFWTVE